MIFETAPFLQSEVLSHQTHRIHATFVPGSEPERSNQPTARHLPSPPPPDVDTIKSPSERSTAAVRRHLVGFSPFLALCHRRHRYLGRGLALDPRLSRRAPCSQRDGRAKHAQRNGFLSSRSRSDRDRGSRYAIYSGPTGCATGGGALKTRPVQKDSSQSDETSENDAI